MRLLLDSILLWRRATALTVPPEVIERAKIKARATCRIQYLAWNDRTGGWFISPDAGPVAKRTVYPDGRVVEGGPGL